MEKISLSIFNIVSVLSIFATILFVFQLYFLKSRNTSTRYFSIYLIIISLIVVFFLALDIDYQKVAIGMLPLFMLAVLSLGPILWLSVNSAVGGKKVEVRKHLLIPITVSLVILLLLVLIVLLKDEATSEILREVLTYFTITALTVLFLLQSGYYIFQSLKLYKKHLKRVGEVFSYTEQVNLSWLKLLVYGYVIFVLCLIFSNLLDGGWSDLFFNSILFFYIIFSGYHALKHEPVFKDVDDIGQGLKVKVDVKTPLFIELKGHLQDAMEKDKLFLDDSLTIHALANSLNTNSKYLSQLINTEFGKSFVVFVNEFRINEAKVLLLDDKNKKLTIEGVGYEAGFKSKSAFNSAFKKITGDTPSSFLKKGI